MSATKGLFALTPQELLCLFRKNLSRICEYYCLVGNITTRKHMQLTKISRATACRELTDLVEKKYLKATADKRRSAAYEINWPE